MTLISIFLWIGIGVGIPPSPTPKPKAAEAGIASGAIPAITFGGRALGEGHVFLLDVDRRSPRILELDRERVERAIPIDTKGLTLDDAGLAYSEGILWALADRGTILVGWDRSGKALDSRVLPGSCQKVWDVQGRVLLALATPLSGRPVILEAAGWTFRACETLRTRPARNALESAALNILLCGTSRLPEVPCWWGGGEAVLELAGPGCAFRRSTVPSLVRPRKGRDRSEDPFQNLAYPIRDVFELERDVFWILTNQEGEMSPFDEGASLGRHLILASGGRALKTVALRKRGRVILDADRESVRLLYGDGSVERVVAP